MSCSSSDRLAQRSSMGKAALRGMCCTPSPSLGFLGTQVIPIFFLLPVGLEDDEGSWGQRVLCCEMVAADVG